MFIVFIVVDLLFYSDIVVTITIGLLPLEPWRGRKGEPKYIKTCFQRFGCVFLQETKEEKQHSL
jgi:hypothetical protein